MNKLQPHTKEHSEDNHMAKSSVRLAALRLARADIKNELRNKGMKVSRVDPHEITRAAKELIDKNPTYMQQAKETNDRG